MPTGKCCYHHPHHKNLFTAHGDQHRKAQPDTRQRRADHGEPGPTDPFTSQFLCLRFRELCARGWRDCKRPNTRKSESTLRKGCVNKSRTITISMDMWMWSGEILGGGSPLNTDQQALMTAERIVSLFQEWATFLVVQCKVVSRKSYIHKQQKQTQ